MPATPPLGRTLVLFVGCAVFFQLVLFLKSNLSSSTSNHGPFGASSASSPVSYHHPTVPLSLQDLEVLDGLAETISNTESYRVFENKEAGRIHGTSITKDPALVRKIRDQLQCWTTHGTWQREDKLFKPLKHVGDSRFSKCDKNFIKGLDREGGGHYLGEYDNDNERFMIREAVKYKWVPDEKICGPGSEPGMMGLGDQRSVYRHHTKKEFCQAVNQRDILIVGDLTQFQLHDVLLSAFQTSYVCYGELGCLNHAPHGLCQNVALKFARNDVLSVPWAVDPESEEFPSASTVEQQWATPDMLMKYKVLILNRGLFWRSDEVFLSELVFTMRHLWKYYPNTLVIYRATHPMSEDCVQLKNKGEDEAIADKFGNSVLDGADLQRPLKEVPKRHADEYGDRNEYRPTLADIQRQNRMAKHVVEAAGGIFLDTETMFALRPDGRMGDGDCARFCAPGPLDAYADLIYNTFRILQV